MANDNGSHERDDGHSGDQEMHAERETFGEPPAKTGHRVPWGAIAEFALEVALTVGCELVVASFFENKGKLSASVPRGAGRTLDHFVAVREHQRSQPYGANRSLRKYITIPAHHRGPARAA